MPTGMDGGCAPAELFTTEEPYPGFRPELLDDGPRLAEAAATFDAEDESRFWFLDFHWPRGFTPMGLVYVTDGYCWASQLGARSLPLASGNGLAARLGGTHLYCGEVRPPAGWEAATRMERMCSSLPGYLQRFPDEWAALVAELEAGHRYFADRDPSGRPLPELRQYLVDARSFLRRAWEIHFAVMYPLVANYVAFADSCRDLGIEVAMISKFLQGYDTKILECDREMWKLAVSARDAGLAGLFASQPAASLQPALKSGGPTAQRWLAEFDAFLGAYGWRTEGIADVNLPAWVEDPTSPLGTIRTFLATPEAHDFERAHATAIAERESAIDSARAQLTAGQLARFDAALASCQHANFAWWNDEHNYYIDLRASIPMRRACLAIAAALGADRVDDTLYLFWPEMMSVLDGAATWGEYRGLVDERRDYFAQWEKRRGELPKVIGSIPESVTDPIMLEIFGMHHRFFEAVQRGGDVEVLLGVAASAGVASGRARVLHSAGALHEVQPGEVLVCEATSPNWTPAFGKIAACVCDSGGTLTHAAIVSREYRVPCVVGVATATSAICTGDIVRVDGDRGVVEVLERARG